MDIEDRVRGVPGEYLDNALLRLDRLDELFVTPF